MNIRKLSLFFSLILLMFCSFGISAAAAEVRELIVNDMPYNVYGLYNGVKTNITSTCSKSLTTFNGVECVSYSLPSKPSSTDSRFVLSYEITNLNSANEYNLNFKFSTTTSSYSTMMVYIVYLDSSNVVLKEQSLDTIITQGNGWNNVDFDFVPDMSGITTGYKAYLSFYFLTTEASSFTYRISNIVTLTDKSDVSGDLSRILNAILTLDTNIDGYLARFETGVIQKLNTLDSHIDTYFDELGGALVSAITTLDTHIDGYFDLLLSGIIANDNALSDKLHEYLDKFKPRFYESFNWIFGRVNSSGNVLTNTDSNAVTSDLFTVGDITYYGYFTPISPFLNATCYIYDLNGNYLTSLYLAPGQTYTLAPGQAYRFSLSSNQSLGHLDLSELNTLCNECIVVYADEGWLTAFRNSIVRGFYEIMNPGVYEEPTSNAWEDSKDEFDRIESELPTFDASDMAEVDISDYAGAFGCVRYLFDRFVSVSGLTTLLTFALVFGLGVFLIGRKVGG